MMISLILLKRYWQNETNDSKKNHQQWPEWATRAVQRQVSLDTSGQLVWLTLFTILWSFFVLLNSSHQNFSNNTGDIIIKASVYLKDYFFFLCFFSLLLVICEKREKKNHPTRVTRFGYCWHIFLYCWTRLVKIFQMILIMSSLKFQYISEIFLFFFFLFFFILSPY